MNHQQSVKTSSDTGDVESAIKVDSPKLEYDKIDNGEHGGDDVGVVPQNDDQTGSGSTSPPQMSGLPFYVAMGSITLGVLLMALNNTALGTVRKTLRHS